jgi:hypothetical protein
MDPKTRKKLEAAGWKTGDAREFLELSDAEAEFIEMKLALAQDLRARRLERHLNQTQVARIVGSSQSRVAIDAARSPHLAGQPFGRSVPMYRELSRRPIPAPDTGGDGAGCCPGLRPDHPPLDAFRWPTALGAARSVRLPLHAVPRLPASAAGGDAPLPGRPASPGDLPRDGRGGRGGASPSLD